MDIFLPNGYINIAGIRALGLPFNFLLGGRATGKTYTSLKDALETEDKHILMRRTQSQLDTISKNEFMPYKPLIENGDAPPMISKPLSKYHAGFYELQDNDETKLRGVGIALSTVSNIRGFDASDINEIIYDEFVPERHERPIKDEGSALLNAYETINRNRELYGKKPVQLLALANANDIANPVYMELGLVSAALKLRQSERQYTILQDRGVLLVDIKRSPISQRKAETALYKLSKGSSFASMALDNEFAYNDISQQISRPLREYVPVVSVGELTIYAHKSNPLYYVTGHGSGSCPSFGAGTTDLIRFRRSYANIWYAYLSRRVEFEQYYYEALFTKYFGGR